MGIKHKTPKVSGEEGFAAEWNDEHIIDSDINFNLFSGINVGEPINPSDIATKNYVDSMGGGVIAATGEGTFSGTVMDADTTLFARGIGLSGKITIIFIDFWSNHDGGEAAWYFLRENGVNKRRKRVDTYTGDADFPVSFTYIFTGFKTISLVGNAGSGDAPVCSDGHYQYITFN